MQITAQLIDASNGGHLWADHFDGSFEDVFELQDRVAISVAGVIEPTLQSAEARRSSERPTNDLTAYDLYLRAVPLVDHEEGDKALELLGQAPQRDPHYGPALALAARCHLQTDLHRWTPDRHSAYVQGVELARKALRYAPDGPIARSPSAPILGNDAHGGVGCQTRRRERTTELGRLESAGRHQANSRNRRISSVAARPGEGRVTERTAGVQPAPRERVFMPHSRPSKRDGAVRCTIQPGGAGEILSLHVDTRAGVAI